MTDLIWSFAPWVVFMFTARFASFGVALVAGGLVAIVVLGRAIARHHVHMLDVASLVYFALIGAIVLATRPSDYDLWSRYTQAGAHGALTLIIFASVLLGHPFTESYARESTPEEYWHTDVFRAVNRRISLAWGLAFLVGTISLIVAGSVDVRETLLRTIIPFGALALAYSYTQKQSSAAGSDDAATGPLGVES